MWRRCGLCTGAHTALSTTTTASLFDTILQHSFVFPRSCRPLCILASFNYICLFGMADMTYVSSTASVQVSLFGAVCGRRSRTVSGRRDGPPLPSNLYGPISLDPSGAFLDEKRTVHELGAVSCPVHPFVLPPPCRAWRIFQPVLRRSLTSNFAFFSILSILQSRPLCRRLIRAPRRL